MWTPTSFETFIFGEKDFIWIKKKIKSHKWKLCQVLVATVSINAATPLLIWSFDSWCSNLSKLKTFLHMGSVYCKQDSVMDYSNNLIHLHVECTMDRPLGLCFSCKWWHALKESSTAYFLHAMLVCGYVLQLFLMVFG